MYTLLLSLTFALAPPKPVPVFYAQPQACHEYYKDEYYRDKYRPNARRITARARQLRADLRALGVTWSSVDYWQGARDGLKYEHWRQVHHCY